MQEKNKLFNFPIVIAFVLISVYVTFVHRVYKEKLTEKHDHH